MFAFYYLWWDRAHWVSHLGPSYPVTAAASPLPATLDRSGCGTRTNFPGNEETDVSPGLTYDQSKPATILRDVQLAAHSGLRGFLVNWIGTGQAAQSVNSSSFNTRLRYVFDAVHKVNAAGQRFSIILNYQSSAKQRSLRQFTNDFAYFLNSYGHDAALDDTYSQLPEVVMAGTWKYDDATLAGIAGAFKSRMFLIGDEKPATWDAARDQYLDGASYYWSSENPTTNPSAPRTLTHFAATVRRTAGLEGAPKVWLAPLAPGYNAMLLYHKPTCVPRDNGQTMAKLFAANSASHPDGWTLISWNEISEGTYIVPLARYGDLYLTTLTSLLTTGR